MFSSFQKLSKPAIRGNFGHFLIKKNTHIADKQYLNVTRFVIQANLVGNNNLIIVNLIIPTIV